MKKVVCLQNIYFEGRYISAGVEVGLPDEVASNWVKRGLAKFVSEETPVSPNENSTTTTATDPAETPVADDDRPKRGRPPKKNGGKRR